LRFAVVGHVEWVEFVRVDRLPETGEIAHALERFEEPAGGGAVAAVQLARLAGESDLFTALGDDQHAERTHGRLGELGVQVHAATRDAPTRGALTFVDAAGERTITTIGERLASSGEDELPWDRLDGADGVYFTAGDAGALRAARGARVLMATPRAGAVLAESGIALDALVFSDRDKRERTAVTELGLKAPLVVATRGSDGGGYTTADGTTGSWDPAPVPGPVGDSYGAGDSFAAAFLWALADGRDTDESLALAARAGAICMTGRGPYGRLLSAADI
jgi:ribokinase